MLTLKQFQATKKALRSTEEMAAYFKVITMDMQDFYNPAWGPLTALITYDAGEYGTGYIEQYGPNFAVTIESDIETGDLESLEVLLYKYLSPLDENDYPATNPSFDPM